MSMAQQKLTIDQILEYHLKANIGQKITPHLIVGLVHFVVTDCRTQGLAPTGESPQDKKDVKNG